ncbi:MAG TPA: hypothetical protein VEW48_08060 [Thermoanaerobaculia bacterium]|nr:hypothetical protein [Thermoanaerobaculia bacterium]
MSDPITTPATGPGAVTHLIQVQYDPSTLSLAVSYPSMSLNPGDTVVWNFLGIPAGWTPWIEFRRSGNNAFVGPLSGLTQATGGIWGVCRSSGWTGTEPIPFEYRAVVQTGFAAGWDTEGSMVWSAPAHLEVQPTAIGEELSYEVSLGTGTSLDIEPPHQILGPGDAIVLQFPSDLPNGVDAWRPRIKFHLYEGEGTVPNLQLGPFAALTILPGQIRGMGNNRVNGLYHFEVALVSVSTGEIGWMSSGDPVIDNRGGVVAPPD